MKVVFFITILIWGCSGTQERSTKDISYQKAAPVKGYQPKGDSYSSEGNEADALLKESLGRQEGSILRDYERDEDPISSISSNCYQGKFKNAFEIGDKNYNSFKTNPAYWNQIGTCYYLQKDFKKATMFYNRAKGLNGNYIPAYNNLGVVLQAQGEYQKALAFYIKATDLRSGSRTPRFNMANIYLKFGILNKACGIFRSLSATSPGDVDIINALANCSLLNGKYVNAVNEFKRIPSENISEPHIGLNYSIALKLAGKAGQAKEIYEDISTKNLGELRSYYQKVRDYLNRN